MILGKRTKLLLILFFLLGCKNPHEKEYVLYHLIPVDYEGPLISMQSSEGKALEVVVDTLFFKYDKKGMAFYKRINQSYEEVNEWYFYVDEFGEITGECPIFGGTEQTGVCRGRPYSSVIASDKVEMIEYYKDRRFQMFNEMECYKVRKIEK